MAVEKQGRKLVSEASAGQRFLVGANVVVATILVVAIVVVAQAIAFSTPSRWDMTLSGVNSLSDATENLLRGLDGNIRLTSLYFETDREEEDQPRYRRAAEDLLNLYEATNRAKISAEWINPLKDHQKFSKLLARLREKTAFKDQIENCRARIDKYTGELDSQMRDLVQSELARIDELGGSIGDSTTQAVVAPIEHTLMRRANMLDAMRERIDSFALAENPQYTAAINELKSLYRDFAKVLKDIGEYGSEQLQRNPALPAEYGGFLGEASNRYADLVAAVEEETTLLQELETLKIDDLLDELGPTANPILVETDEDAMVVDFSSVWPPMQEGAVRSGLHQRAFKGEERLTSAILRATHKEQTAVVFVRYGGTPLFLGGFMPNQPPAPYTAMKEQLEDANFVVEEWDLKSSQTPPTIDPAPTRTIYVVLKPTPPQRGPMGQPSQEPPFSGSHRQAVLGAIGDSGRALFIAGWSPGPFGPIPSTYEYNDYLDDQWGIKVDSSALLIETMSIAPGKYAVGRRMFHQMQDLSVSNHDIVTGALTRELGLPACAPLELSEAPPEGVEHARLVHMPARDGIWGVKNLMKYQEQQQLRQYLTREEGDLEGPFDLAVAATKGDAKIVVISSSDFAVDNIAFAREMALTSRGFTVRSRNPGNVSLMINSLHWLNDNTEFMNIGKPIDAAVLEIESESTVRAVRVFAIGIWPALALVCGGAVWWVRRR